MKDKERKVHELKTLKPYYRDVLSGLKTFEVRKNDRDYKVRDGLILREWTGTEYTGGELLARVNYILDGGQYGISPDYVVMAIQVIRVT